jgi:hypothetical protein
MTNQEFTDVLDYLLTKLREMGANEIASDINKQINRGKTLTVKDSSDLSEKKIKQKDVGKTQILPLSSKEAFELAIDYLERIIMDVPGYSEKISKNFGNQILWEVDQSQSLKDLNTTDKFTLNDLNFDKEDISKAKDNLIKIKKYLQE